MSPVPLTTAFSPMCSQPMGTGVGVRVATTAEVGVTVLAVTVTWPRWPNDAPL